MAPTGRVWTILYGYQFYGTCFSLRWVGLTFSLVPSTTERGGCVEVYVQAGLVRSRGSSTPYQRACDSGGAGGGAGSGREGGGCPLPMRQGDQVGRVGGRWQTLHHPNDGSTTCRPNAGRGGGGDTTTTRAELHAPASQPRPASPLVLRHIFAPCPPLLDLHGRPQGDRVAEGRDSPGQVWGFADGRGETQHNVNIFLQYSFLQVFSLGQGILITVSWPARGVTWSR